MDHASEPTAGTAVPHALTHGQMARALRLGSAGAADPEAAATHMPGMRGGLEDWTVPIAPTPRARGARAGASITAAMLVVTVLGTSVASEKHVASQDSGRMDASGPAGGGLILSRGAAPRDRGSRDAATAIATTDPPSQEPSKMLSKLTGVTAAAAVGVSASIAGAQGASRVLSSPAIGAGVVIPHSSAQNAPIVTGHMTIEFWLRHESGIGRVVNKRECSYEGYTILTRPVEGGTQLEVGFGTGEVAFLWNAGVVPTAQWRHVAVVWSSSAGNVRLVIDGSTINSTTIAPGQVPGTSEYPLRFAEQCGGGFVGAMDNVRIWAVARTDAEIHRYRFVEFSTDMAALVPGLVGCWDFQDADSVVDRRGLNAAGTFYGGASSVEQVRPGHNEQPAVQWKVEDGGNGHWYRVIQATSFDGAMASASAHGAHLATATSAAENAKLTALLGTTSASRAHIGLMQPDNQTAVNVGWQWVTGEPISFTQWRCFGGSIGCAPDDTPCGTRPYRIEDNQANCGALERNGDWDDLEKGAWCDGGTRVAIIEWSADCNADGIVDYGQILQGQLADVNANGVPDSCECLSDINDDGWVDGVDLGIVLASWSTDAAGAPADLNRDGAVDGADLGVLLSAWGACGP